MSKKSSPLALRPLRVPGQSIQEEMDRLADDRLLPYVLVPTVLIVIAAWEWTRWYLKLPPQPIVITAVTAIATVYAAIRLVGLRKRLMALRLGRDGERIVAENLARLRSVGGVLFHDLKGPDFNVDHVVVSRRGIFAIETKTYSKRPGAKVHFDGATLIVDGLRPDRDPINQARANALWVANQIKKGTGKALYVKPVVVFPGWFVNPVEEQGGSDVWVLTPEGLASFIANQSLSLDDEEFRSAVVHVAAMGRSETVLR